MALQFSDSARVLLDQQLVNLTDARQELIETESRDDYYLLRLHNIDVTLSRSDVQTFMTVEQLEDLIQEVEALVEALREDGYAVHLHTIEDEVIDVLKQAAKQRRVRNTVNRNSLRSVAATLRRIRISIESASMDTDKTVERHKQTKLSVKATTRRLRAISNWLDTNDPSSSTNDHRPPHWTDDEVEYLLRVSRELRIMRESFLVTNSTTTGLAPVLNQLGLLYETFRTEERVRRLRPAELRYASRQLRDTADMVEQLDTEGIIDDDDKLQRWIEFANEDLLSKMHREDILELPMQTVIDRFLLTWHSIIIDLTSPDAWTMVTDAPTSAWNEWWLIVGAVFRKLWTIFTHDDRLLYVGIGFVVAAFFVFFITLTA